MRIKKFIYSDKEINSSKNLNILSIFSLNNIAWKYMSLKVLHEPKSINAAGANTVNCVLLIIHNYSQRILYPLPIIDRTSRPKKKKKKESYGRFE